ncbi:MAG TPA: DUF3987 domain-containing protein [Nitrospira sp.]|nr:DUF3987 domain-containing protein [Nitrospira sp.]
MSQEARWGHIPLELRQRQQWCFTQPGSKAPRGRGNYLVSDTEPSQWMTFEEACGLAAFYKGAIGYCLTPDDPYTCIDMDVKDASNCPEHPDKWTTQAQFDRYWAITQAFNTYTEKSFSGKGLHLWVRGNIGTGARRDGVEVYSQWRFIVTTGDIVVNAKIEERTELLNILVQEIRAAQAAQYEKVDLVEEDEELDDHDLLARAMSAGNAEKFNALCRCTSAVGDGTTKVHGSYIELGYQSQSEADLALMSIFTFYSKSNEQCKRLFRMSGLGQRPKAQDDDRYLNETLRTIRSRQAKEQAAEFVQIQSAANIVQRLAQERGAQLHVPGAGEPVATAAPASVGVVSIAPVDELAGLNGETDRSLDWPPGLAGHMAYYIYQSSPRPVKEVSIVAALGLLAGICGKAFNIPQSGLNLYIILIARSGVGKEAMHSGIASLIQAAASRQPPVMSFVDFNDFASGPALNKAVAVNQSFVNVAGEWGRKLRRLALEDGRDGPMQQLRTVMTNLYQKSGPQSIVGGITYSNRDTNIASVQGVAYSMIGESTPGTFYEALTPSMMEDGFLSRFTIIEYNGMRPPLNHAPLREPSKVLGDAVADLCTHAHTLLSRHESQQVQRSESAATKLQAFEIECDAQINATHDEMWRQMWNRASLKVMRVSALLAVAENWLNPIISDEHVDWAMDLIRRDINIMTRRIDEGDIGIDDSAREKKMMRFIRNYLQYNIGGIDVPEQMRKDGVVPRKILASATARINCFMKYRGGATAALNETLKSMCDSGYLIEIDKAQLIAKYAYTGKCYRVLQIRD